MTDSDIIQGLKDYDEAVTKEYFYGYCRKAYNIFNRKYQLRGKVGLDFYSLAHEYYIKLMTHEFKDLDDRPENTPLSTWMIGGFRYVMLDALKAYQKETEHTSKTVCDDVLEFVRSTDKREGLMYDVADAVAAHYYDDRKMQELAYEIFVLGYKQNEVSKQLGLTPSAINQRYKKMMNEVVTPFVIENYSDGIYYGGGFAGGGVSAICHDEFDEGICKACIDETPDESPTTFNLRRFSNSRYMENNRKDPRDGRITPDYITSLKPNEIFVFGSNLHGIHAGGAARTAVLHFGAEMGNGIGIQGQSYAIPTMQGGVETIQPYVDDFIAFAKQHTEMHFLVTPIGCGIAGFDADEIAPLFKEAVKVENISLPDCFWDELL